MTTDTTIKTRTFFTICRLTIILCGLFTVINVSEFYLIGILKKTYDYPFGGEGPTPYYYKTAGLYSTVNFIWGLIFLATLLLTIWTIIKGQRKNIFWFLGLTVLLILGQFLHGQIGT